MTAGNPVAFNILKGGWQLSLHAFFALNFTTFMHELLNNNHKKSTNNKDGGKYS